MAEHYLKLQASEVAVVGAAAQIYAACIASGKVAEGSEKEWIERAVQSAVAIAKRTDDLVTTDAETGMGG